MKVCLLVTNRTWTPDYTWTADLNIWHTHAYTHTERSVWFPWRPVPVLCTHNMARFQVSPDAYAQFKEEHKSPHAHNSKHKHAEPAALCFNSNCLFQLWSMWSCGPSTGSAFRPSWWEPDSSNTPSTWTSWRGDCLKRRTIASTHARIQSAAAEPA